MMIIAIEAAGMLTSHPNKACSITIKSFKRVADFHSCLCLATMAISMSTAISSCPVQISLGCFLLNKGKKSKQLHKSI